MSSKMVSALKQITTSMSVNPRTQDTPDAGAYSGHADQCNLEHGERDAPFKHPPLHQLATCAIKSPAGSATTTPTKAGNAAAAAAATLAAAADRLEQSAFYGGDDDEADDTCTSPGTSSLRRGNEVRINCNGNRGHYLLDSQQIVCRCCSSLMTPTEFERHSGMHAAKKWRRSIKIGDHDGEPTLGSYLESEGIAVKPKVVVSRQRDGSRPTSSRNTPEPASHHYYDTQGYSSRAAASADTSTSYGSRGGSPGPRGRHATTVGGYTSRPSRFAPPAPPLDAALLAQGGWAGPGPASCDDVANILLCLKHSVTNSGEGEGAGSDEENWGHGGFGGGAAAADAHDDPDYIAGGSQGEPCYGAGRRQRARRVPAWLRGSVDPLKVTAAEEGDGAMEEGGVAPWQEVAHPAYVTRRGSGSGLFGCKRTLLEGEATSSVVTDGEDGADMPCVDSASPAAGPAAAPHPNGAAECSPCKRLCLEGNLERTGSNGGLIHVARAAARKSHLAPIAAAQQQGGGAASAALSPAAIATLPQIAGEEEVPVVSRWRQTGAGGPLSVTVRLGCVTFAGSLQPVDPAAISAALQQQQQ